MSPWLNDNHDDDDDDERQSVVADLRQSHRETCWKVWRWKLARCRCRGPGSATESSRVPPASWRCSGAWPARSRPLPSHRPPYTAGSFPRRRRQATAADATDCGVEAAQTQIRRRPVAGIRLDRSARRRHRGRKRGSPAGGRPGRYGSRTVCLPVTDTGRVLDVHCAVWRGEAGSACAFYCTASRRGTVPDEPVRILSSRNVDLDASVWLPAVSAQRTTTRLTKAQ